MHTARLKPESTSNSNKFKVEAHIICGESNILKHPRLYKKIDATAHEKLYNDSYDRRQFLHSNSDMLLQQSTGVVNLAGSDEENKDHPLIMPSPRCRNNLRIHKLNKQSGRVSKDTTSNSSRVQPRPVKMEADSQTKSKSMDSSAVDMVT